MAREAARPRARGAILRPLKRLATSCVLLVALAAPACAFGATSDRVSVYLTGNDGRTHLTRQPDLRFGAGPGSAGTTIAVDPGHQLQTVNGFGGALTDSSLYLLSRLSSAERSAALHRLFDPRTGIGLSVVRVPIGSSDFTASSPYSYDDLPVGQTDPTLAHFSIGHDQAYVLPILREVLKINPAVRIIANPWSPPAWMKTNDSLLAVSPTGGPGTLLPQDYGPLAEYFVRFIEAYRSAGIPIWAITPQNEPVQPTVDYSGMFLAPEDEARFVSAYLAPALRTAGLEVRIYGYDYTWAGTEAYVPVLLGTGAGVGGIAFHCYFGAPDSMSAIHAAYPSEDLIEDECSTGISVLSPIQVLVRSIANDATAVLMWNLVLDPAGGPKVGSGCLNCIGLATADVAHDSVSYTGDFFQVGQASSFLTRGARVISSSTAAGAPSCANSPVCGLESAAFHDPDGRDVLIVTNSGPAQQSFLVRRPDGLGFEYSLPGQVAPNGADNSRDASVVTFVWGGAPSGRHATHRARRRRRGRHRARFTG